MKFLVLGCNGMAGHMISLWLTENGHSVTGFDLRPSPLIESVSGDACDGKLIRELVGTNEYEVVINCIGVLNRAAEENKPLAVTLNSWLPHYLAAITEGTETRVFHLSTDCVFSGKRGGYAESDLRDGETFYDRTKALGEINDGRNLTLRQSIVGPDMNPNGIGLLNWFMQQNGVVNGYTGAIWTGQTTLQLAKTIEKAAENGASGLVNAVPEKSINKFGLLSLFNKYIRKGELKIIPYEKMLADKSLIRTVEAGVPEIPDYETMIRELADWMREHRRLYPHYRLV